MRGASCYEQHRPWGSGSNSGAGGDEEPSAREKHCSRLPYWKTGCFYPDSAAFSFLSTGQTNGDAHTTLSGSMSFFYFTT